MNTEALIYFFHLKKTTFPVLKYFPSAWHNWDNHYLTITNLQTDLDGTYIDEAKVLLVRESE